MRSFIFAALAVLPTMAAEGPVSLDCDLIDQRTGKHQRFAIQLNEGTESASYPHPSLSGEIVRWRAFFTPRKVTFSSFTIDRATLAFERSDRGLMGDGPLRVDAGKCVIDRTEKAF